ncbi:Crp/Fnr family transcriptional regulator [Myroides sp. LJL115]
MDNLTAHIQRYLNLTDEKLVRIGEFFEGRTFKKKEFLLRESSSCKEKFFICEGLVQICFTKENGNLQTVDFALENWWATDFSAFTTKSNSQYSIQAVENTKVLVLSFENQKLLLAELPELERYFHLVFQQAYSATQNRIKLLYSFSREELYEHFQANYPQFTQRVPQYLLASFLGLSSEYLSKIRKKRIS